MIRLYRVTLPVAKLLFAVALWGTDFNLFLLLGMIQLAEGALVYLEQQGTGQAADMLPKPRALDGAVGGGS